MAVNPVTNISIPQGADFSKTFIAKESDGSATDLSGYSATAKIKKHYDSTNLTSFTVGITSSTGGVKISLTAAQTVALDAGRQYYDVRLVSSASTVSRLVEGMAFVNAGITT
jgi:hypothetical protein